jgi:hypothetical protein
LLTDFGNTSGDAIFLPNPGRFHAGPLLYAVAAGSWEDLLAYLETTSHDSKARGETSPAGLLTFDLDSRI